MGLCTKKNITKHLSKKEVNPIGLCYGNGDCQAMIRAESSLHAQNHLKKCVSVQCRIYIHTTFAVAWYKNLLQQQFMQPSTQKLIISRVL